MELSSELRSQLGDAVLSGLFKGMVIPDGYNWGGVHVGSRFGMAVPVGQ
jgi:hypothetical protein